MPALLKHVGRGARLAKDLPRDEAREAMRLILSGEADDVQTGGFLIALRMKSESADELAGFVDAMRDTIAPFAPAGDDPRPLVDVDLHADGREGRPSLSLASACLAAAAGVRVLLRGAFGGRFARNDLDDVVARLGSGPFDPQAAAIALAGPGVAVLDLSTYAPRVAALFALRERLGVRTCINSAVKLLDPAVARRQLIGIFHTPYHAPIAGAARALGVKRAAVVQAPGGVPELPADKQVKVTLVDDALPPQEPTPIHGGGRDATVLGAGLMLWAAGLSPHPLDDATLARLHATLLAGAAGHVLAATRSCYSST